MRPGAWLGIVGVVAVATACGASSKEIKSAKSAVYQCEYPVVWDAVHAEFTDKYSKVAEQSAEAGVLVSEWEWYDSSGARKRGMAGTVSVSPEDVIFRIALQVIKDEASGGWKIMIDGSAQRHVAGSGQMVTVKRGGGDEPAWVQTKIDNLWVVIYERLKQYDTAAAAAK